MAEQGTKAENPREPRISSAGEAVERAEHAESPAGRKGELETELLALVKKVNRSLRSEPKRGLDLARHPLVVATIAGALLGGVLSAIAAVWQSREAAHSLHIQLATKRFDDQQRTFERFGDQFIRSLNSAYRMMKAGLISDSKPTDQPARAEFDRIRSEALRAPDPMSLCMHVEAMFEAGGQGSARGRVFPVAEQMCSILREMYDLRDAVPTKLSTEAALARLDALNEQANQRYYEILKAMGSTLREAAELE